MVSKLNRQANWTTAIAAGVKVALSRVPILTTVAIALIVLLSFRVASADGPPNFFKESLPEHAMEKMIAGYGALQGDGAVLDARIRELIALAVSAQIPCEYCVYAHRRNALAAGASEAELREAVAAGAFVRLWSTMFQGAEINLESFKLEHDILRGDGS